MTYYEIMQDAIRSIRSNGSVSDWSIRLECQRAMMRAGHYPTFQSIADMMSAIKEDL
jgi:hypothetical protein